MKILLFLLSLCCIFSLAAKERFIYVARHCQAGGSGPDILRPVRGDAGISKLGVEQSKLLGKRLKALGFKGKIYVSPYYRTVATACYAAAECGVKVYPDARVQERVSTQGGNMKRGATLAMLKKLFPEQIAKDAKLPDKWLYTQIETLKSDDHRKRMAKALDDILAENPDSDIMIVSHAGAVGGLYREMRQRSGQKLKNAATWNCALYRYAVDDKGKFRCVKYDLDFLPVDMVTSNHHKITPKQRKRLEKMLSGIDPKYK